jgi:hypothetical protein
MKAAYAWATQDVMRPLEYNSVFSRPYDLTRHGDTIHNARKQKVRCHLYNKEKTFSRNDALTKHMRAVHPEIDWPAKTRRKNERELSREMHSGVNLEWRGLETELVLSL